MHGEFKIWLKENSWFGEGDSIKTAEFLGIATAIREKTNLTGALFLSLVESIWKSSDIKEYPKHNGRRH